MTGKCTRPSLQEVSTDGTPNPPSVDQDCVKLKNIVGHLFRHCWGKRPLGNARI